MNYRLHGIVLLLALAGVLIGCSKESQPAAPAQSVSATSEAPGEEVAPAREPGLQVAQADYPIDFCIVSGEKLGEMGDPVKVEVEGRTVLLCCEMCKDDLMKDPKAYLAKLDSAIAAGKTTEPAAEAGHGEHQH